MSSGDNAPDDPLAPIFPAERALVSGLDAPYVGPDELDSRTFQEIEQGRRQVVQQLAR